MNWTIEYIESDDYVRVTFEGTFAISRNKQMFDEIVSHESWKPGTSIFFDNRNIDLGQIEYPVMMRAAQNYKDVSEQLGKGRAAMLMKSALDFGYGRQFEQLTEFKGKTEMRVFTDEAEALGWLLKLK